MENTVNTAPVGQLKTNKGLLKTILLTLITFGIYPLVVMSAVSNDVNIVASRYDGKKTMHYCLLFFIVAPPFFSEHIVLHDFTKCNSKIKIFSLYLVQNKMKKGRGVYE